MWLEILNLSGQGKEVQVCSGDEDRLRVGVSSLWAPLSGYVGENIRVFREAVALVGAGSKMDGRLSNASTAGSVQSSVPACEAVAGPPSCCQSHSDYLLW